MNHVSAYVDDGLVGGVDRSPVTAVPRGVEAAGSLGWGGDVASERPPAVPPGFDPTGGIPVLDAPVQAQMLSRTPLEAGPGVEMDRAMAEVMKSLDFKLSMGFRNGSMTLEDVIEVAQMGLQYTRDLQKRQGEIVQKARLEAIQQATKDADAGILGKIFGWIARVFSIVFLALASVALVSTGQVGVALLTITALVLTVLDFCGAISKACGGPDISYAGLIAMIAEACGASKEAADAVRQWLGLAVQIVTAVIGTAGGCSAAAKVGEMIGKAMNAVLALVSGATAIASGATGIVSAQAHYQLVATQVAEMQAQAFHEVILANAKRWADDLQDFRDDLDAALKQRSDWLSNEHALNVRLSAA